MQSRAPTVEAYLESLPPDRRKAIEALREVILKNIDKTFDEGMQYGMIGYYVPHSVFPDGYHCDPKQPLPFAGLASQKNHISVYMMSMYSNGKEEKWFRAAWAREGKKLDMGKCCIRFRKLDDVPLNILGEAFKRVKAADYIAYYQSMLSTSNKSKRSAGAKNTSVATSPGKAKSKARSSKNKKEGRS